MLFVVLSEWKAKDIPKVIEARSKVIIPPELKVISEVTLFGQHRGIMIFDSPDEKTVFKSLVPYLQVMTLKVMPALTIDDSVKLVTGK